MERKLAAILSGDVEGYSRLMGDNEVATVHTITEYREAIASAMVRHGGRVVDAPGDNVLAEFSSVVDAVQCAFEIQGELRSRNAGLPFARRMQFRIGIQHEAPAPVPDPAGFKLTCGSSTSPRFSTSSARGAVPRRSPPACAWAC